MLSLSTFLGACAGPSSPFGKIEPNISDLAKDLARQPANRNESNKDSPDNLDFELEMATDLDFIDIEISPDRQLLHDKSELKITIIDPKGIPSNHKFKIFYDLIDVTESFLKNSHMDISDDHKKMTFTLKNFRLIPAQDNEIIIGYRRSSISPIVYTEYKKPDCNLRESTKLGKIRSFRIDQMTMMNIENVAQDNNLNPNFLAGLVAQESGFNPNAVSFARAIGLTQVTPIAEKHIIKKYPSWPKHEKINTLPIPIVKSLISFGKINQDNEWRLNKKTSLIGGAEYLAYIERYWKKDENIWLLNNFFTDSDHVIDDIILASYNSGPYRVKSSIRRLGKDWVKSHQLKEARKYIKKVKSYCYHFSKSSTEKI